MTQDTIDGVREDADSIIDDVDQYLRLQKKRIRLEVIEQISVSMTEFIYFMTIGILSFGLLLIGCVVVGLVVQQIWGNWILSALTSTSLFLLLGGLFVYRGKAKIRDLITRILMNVSHGQPKE